MFPLYKKERERHYHVFPSDSNPAYDKVTIVPNYKRTLRQTYDQTYDKLTITILLS